MTTTTVVIAVFSASAHLHSLGPSQEMTKCAYIVACLTLSGGASI